jgi:hypothetical protein
MERWFQARWSPVGGHCSRAPAYIVFCEPDPNYIRLSLCDDLLRKKSARTRTACLTGRESSRSQRSCTYIFLMGMAYCYRAIALNAFGSTGRRPSNKKLSMMMHALMTMPGAVLITMPGALPVSLQTFRGYQDPHAYTQASPGPYGQV